MLATLFMDALFQTEYNDVENQFPGTMHINSREGERLVPSDTVDDDSPSP
jgi:hypothetical protein